MKGRELPGPFFTRWEDSVEARATRGGSSRKSVEDQIEELKKAFVVGGGG
jgi:hypothetical protein